MRRAFLLALLASCASTARIERETTGDVDAVRAAAAALVGQDPPPRASAPDGGSIDAAVREMLAGELDEATALKIALLNNREVRERYERLGVARAELVQAGLLRNPVFAGNAKFFDGGTEVELTLAGSFIELFHRPLRKRIAAADLETAKAEVTRGLGYITMGGMLTVLKVRERDPDAAGWYENPPGTLAQPATGDQMRADGIAG